MTTHRDFLAANAALFATSVASSALAAVQVPSMPAKDRLSILFLGGTAFIGPHQIGYALARGHDVAMFNRDRRPL